VNDVDQRLERTLTEQRAAFQAEGGASAAIRIERIERAIRLLVDNERAIVDAIAADFGQRPPALSRFTDILPAVRALQHARKHVRRWMRPRRCHPELPFRLAGVRTELLLQPLGVVGLISPWNFPVNLSFCPLAGVLAAGNRCMMKPSELTPQTSALLQQLVAQAFDTGEVSVITGDAQVAERFSRLPFDHLLFTGSTAVGRRVMAAAAEHLVPVTLELGGKCPTVIGRSAAIDRAVDRILLGKLANAGQMCLAPDYAYIARESLQPFVEQARRWVEHTYPDLASNRDHTSLINDRHASRVEALLADARAKGAELVELGAASQARPSSRRLLPLTLILRVNDDMRVMQEELFAPLLPLKPYDAIDEVIDDINRRPRPLALYYFGEDRDEEHSLLARTASGGVTINDVAMHVLVEDLPFGGIGASGMGAYHGEHGFRRFSHARAVYRQSRLDVAGLMGLRPPYGQRIDRLLQLLIRR
jgi:coniferyl-aldehyde dehydrogenase